MITRHEWKPDRTPDNLRTVTVERQACEELWAASQEIASKGHANNAETAAVADELEALRRTHAKLQQDIFEAAQIQRRLCAPREFNWGEFEIAGEIFPVRHLSGDFLKVMELGSDLGLVLGDIAGKGLTAGIWLAHLLGLIQRYAREYANPAEAVAAVNRELCQDPGEPPLTAMFFARIDAVRGELLYCNAGLPAPVLWRHDKRLEKLEEGGPMMGAVPGGIFKTGSVILNPGDMLIAHSDGVTECRNSEDQEFDMQRLLAAAESASGTSANLALFSTLGAVLDFADACSPGDDVTLLVLRRRGGVRSWQSRMVRKDLSMKHGRNSSVRTQKAGRGTRGFKQPS
jgi:serine phosphatase RsbU (regulator of sigma subunit)